MMDLHCHVDLYPDFEVVLKDIKDTGFYVLSVTTVPSAWEGTKNLTKDIPRVKTALGFHPQVAHLRENELALFENLIAETRYIGEVGLDGSRGFKAYFAIQTKVFTEVLKLCQRFEDKILTIHSLGAVEEVLDCLAMYPGSGVPIFHWFLGTKKQIDKAVQLSGFFSVGPAMLLSARGRKVVGWIPRDKMLLESDGPFAKLGERSCYPSDVRVVINYLCDLWGMTEREVHSQLEINLRTLLM
ncbi:TatD family deoxyribonuclease [Vibrio parahaemolyticus]|uniref:Qat anti-phage system TatD family nuclease QatD n=1 Tax=Vibrio TaxID=662 RepID=UPI0004028F59|nr:Qat anti-phage system TatD family nuclease QatD [Vibrio parahaemolyticus]MBE4346460.1 TatD family deoxyribonuclease [Vibrio parahaemolyticus]MDF4748136.1 TatD family hydrolase [Vibrio parahaemolyticus]MDF5665118.1 TatD family hydrolase [Vibrio parahaemolyticus]OOX29408.1 hydrolase TatD [Vibrio parahaemolyticus]